MFKKNFFNFFLPFFFILIVLLYTKIIFQSFYPPLPKRGEVAKFYSNQCRDDLNFLFLHAIKKAKKSIHLVMFGLNDSSILKALDGKSLDMKVFYDKRSSDISLKRQNFYPLKTSGLVHQKILVIDKKMVFIGSANMTKTSLLMHNNLVIGFYSPKIAKFLEENTPFNVAKISSKVGGQKIELFLLPNKEALERIKKIIRSAKEKIQIAMFTFTNQELIDELCMAKKRGVEISVVIDYNSAIGTSAQTVERLKNEKIKVMLSQGIQLLHHKHMLVDEKIFVCGSANWTKAAFNKNKDLVLIFSLAEKQKKFMKKLQKIIEKEALDL